MSRKFSSKYKLTQERREKIGFRFHEVILEHGYEDLQKFADKYEVSRSTLQHWIADGMINIEFMRVFCEEFNIDLRWLLFGPPWPKHQKPRP
jgi:hypothetical protein